MWNIMNACVIMQNMIIESERDPTVILKEPVEDDHYVKNPFDCQGNLSPVVSSVPQDFSKFLSMH